jgi:hypothetical protein
MALKEIGWEDVDCMHLAEDLEQWLALVNMVMNIRIPQKVKNSVTI